MNEQFAIQSIAQLFPEIGVVVAIDRLDELGDFFDQAIADGAMRLLAVPRATIRRAQTDDDSLEASDGI